jgi:dihydroorotate dehydrogenase electron transfer subunit
VTGERRTQAPFGRRLAEVVANEPAGAYRVISAADREGPSDPRPGQFYMLAAAARWGAGEGERPYVPRAFSFARVGRVEASAPRETRSPPATSPLLDFLLEAVGPGTERLGQLRPGEGMWLTGPLGLGFEAPRDGRRPLLVGGGIGAAPLICWQDELGAGARALLGFRSGAHAEATGLFGGESVVVTDDGSVGRPALVTELLREELDRDDAVVVYSCGPPPMLEGVRAICAERGVPAQLALESGMACGFGACMGCVVPTRDGYVRLCVDGPVLNADELETALVPGAGH